MNHKINWDFLGLSGQKEKVTSQGDVTSVRLISVGVPGLEPGKAGPESAVLPLHHTPISDCGCKGRAFFWNRQTFSYFFSSPALFFSIFPSCPYQAAAHHRKKRNNLHICMKLTTFAPTGTPIHMSKWRYTPQILATNHTKKEHT